VSSGYGKTIDVDVSKIERAVVDAAVRSFRRFYPDVTVELSGSAVRASSKNMSAQQLNTAWLGHLLQAKTDETSKGARAALFEKLFR
jgi:autonomous glycyl radical cofactor GrcA